MTYEPYCRRGGWEKGGSIKAPSANEAALFAHARSRPGTTASGPSFVIIMPHYFFDIHDGAVFTADETGVDLDGIEAVRRETGAVLSRIANELLHDGKPHEVVIEVKDEAGQRVLVAKLSASFEQTELPGFSPVE